MAKVLFLAHRVPFPPNKGDKIRAFHILEHLAVDHEIWLGAGADDADDLKYLQTAKGRYRDAHFAPLGPVKRVWNMLLGGLTGSPLSVARFRDGGLARWVDTVLRQDKPNIVYVFSSAMAQYVIGRVGPDVAVIVDFVDADAEKWRAYAADTWWPLRLIYSAEFRRLVAFDRKVLSQSRAGILVSETERKLLAGFLPSGADKLVVIPNGVDTTYFDLPAAQSDGRSIVFCGTMDYRPNIDAVVWFAQEILPKVHERCPDAVFRIVGAKPAASVLALAELPRVEVTGAVPDVRPYLSQAAVVVAPLRIARGIQNKVLEGLSAGRPMVATPEALDGIEATVGQDVLVGADADAFARAVTDVLLGSAPAGLGDNGRRYVVATHQWSAQLQGLDRIIVDVPHPGSGQVST